MAKAEAKKSFLNYKEQLSYSYLLEKEQSAGKQLREQISLKQIQSQEIQLEAEVRALIKPHLTEALWKELESLNLLHFSNALIKMIVKPSSPLQLSEDQLTLLKKYFREIDLVYRFKDALDNDYGVESVFKLMARADHATYHLALGYQMIVECTSELERQLQVSADTYRQTFVEQNQIDLKILEQMVLQVMISFGSYFASRMKSWLVKGDQFMNVAGQQSLDPTLPRIGIEISAEDLSQKLSALQKRVAAKELSAELKELIQNHN